MDEMRERESCAPERDRERGSWELSTERREKIVKKLYVHPIVLVQICMGTIATYIYTQVYTRWRECFFSSDCVKFVTFSILQSYPQADVGALRPDKIQYQQW